MRNRLKNLRKKNSLSQKKLCDELKRFGYLLDRSTYSKYETGDRHMPCDCLVALAKYYRTTTDYILGLSDFSGDS